VPSIFPYTATSTIYPLSLHDALPIFRGARDEVLEQQRGRQDLLPPPPRLRVQRGVGEEERTQERQGDAHRADQEVLPGRLQRARSEEHTSELQSRFDLVCRLLLEKKK